MVNTWPRRAELRGRPAGQRAVRCGHLPHMNIEEADHAGGSSGAHATRVGHVPLSRSCNRSSRRRHWIWAALRVAWRQRLRRAGSASSAGCPATARGCCPAPRQAMLSVGPADQRRDDSRGASHRSEERARVDDRGTEVAESRGMGPGVRAVSDLNRSSAGTVLAKRPARARRAVLQANGESGRSDPGGPAGPHRAQWSWTAAFVSVRLAHHSRRLRSARLRELDLRCFLFPRAVRPGMLPHVVLRTPRRARLLTLSRGALLWGCASHRTTPTNAHAARGAPRAAPAASAAGVHALACRLESASWRDRGAVAARAGGGGVGRRGVARPRLPGGDLPRLLPGMLPGKPLPTRNPSCGSRHPVHRAAVLSLHHGWESGMDTLPRWDWASSRVTVGRRISPPYRRRGGHPCRPRRPQRPTGWSTTADLTAWRRCERGRLYDD
jgi:hypothetical protein